MIFTSPMLACDKDPIRYPKYFEELRFPLLGSPKLDGIRGLPRKGIVLSRKMLLLPSLQVQELFGDYEFTDGELIEGDPTDFGVYNRTQSYVMSENKVGDMHFYVFDYVSERYFHLPFIERLEKVKEIVEFFGDPRLHFVEHELLENVDELLAYEEKVLSAGYEGLIMRDPFGFYKCGRATWREGTMYKLKRFTDAEGKILDILPANQNVNPQTMDETGHAKRSKSKEGLIPKEEAGKYIVEYEDDTLSVGPGAIDKDSCREMYLNKEKYIGQYLKFRFFGHGIKNKPRSPRAIGLRSPIDMGG